MSTWTQEDGIFSPASPDLPNRVKQPLPLGTYSIGLSPAGYFLQQQGNFTLPPKIYGSTPNHAERILGTFADRPRSTGVLLEGEKGSGKTLLATMVSVEAYRRGIPTLLVNAPHHGEGFNSFIQSIDEPCVLLFDEFEKIYHQDQWQNALLTLLDGVVVTRKLSLITINDGLKISRLLRNRPGRVYYSVKYETLEEEFIREYVDDALKNKDHAEALFAITTLFDRFNFDMLKALVEEMNRYGEDPRTALKMLNIRPDFTGAHIYDVTYSVDGKEFPVDQTDTRQVSGHPLDNEDGYEIEFFSVKRYEFNGRGEQRRWTVEFENAHMVHADARKGVYEYQNGEYRMILTKQRAKKTYWDTIRAF